MFHSLTLTKQILAVCSYTLEKHSAKGGRKCSSGGTVGTGSTGTVLGVTPWLKGSQASAWDGRDGTAVNHSLTHQGKRG